MPIYFPHIVPMTESTMLNSRLQTLCFLPCWTNWNEHNFEGILWIRTYSISVTCNCLVDLIMWWMYYTPSSGSRMYISFLIHRLSTSKIGSNLFPVNSIIQQIQDLYQLVHLPVIAAYACIMWLPACTGSVRWDTGLDKLFSIENCFCFSVFAQVRPGTKMPGG